MFLMHALVIEKRTGDIPMRNLYPTLKSQVEKGLLHLESIVIFYCTRNESINQVRKALHILESAEMTSRIEIERFSSTCRDGLQFVI